MCIWDLMHGSEGWMQSLLHVHIEPQELDLLGSGKSQFCIQFTPYYDWRDSLGKRRAPSKEVSPTNKKSYSSLWCNGTKITWTASIQKPRELPKGTFLLCGDQAWAGIPSQLQGGPCMLGRLSLLALGKTQLFNWKKETQLTCQNRATLELDPNCDSQVVSWSFSKRIAASLFLPWAVAAKALSELSHLECWMGKQANLTSKALAQLLEDEETTRHATLQNRAAIDYLLLLHGHRCEEFEGLCCLNLSSNARSIHKTLQEMQQELHQLRTEGADWLQNLLR